jgi:hypothetical protein
MTTYTNKELLKYQSFQFYGIPLESLATNSILNVSFCWPLVGVHVMMPVTLSKTAPLGRLPVSDNVTVSLFGSSAFTVIVIVWLTVTLATTGVIVISGGWLSENTYDYV